MIDVAGLKKNVGFLNWAVGIIFASGLGAIVVSYLMLSHDIGDLSKESAERDRQIVDRISDLRTDSARNFERILVRMPDDQPQRSARAQPAQPVREGAGSGTGRSSRP
jgi:hypothetical protein